MVMLHCPIDIFAVPLFVLTSSDNLINDYSQIIALRSPIIWRALFEHIDFDNSPFFGVTAASSDV